MSVNRGSKIVSVKDEQVGKYSLLEQLRNKLGG